MKKVLSGLALLALVGVGLSLATPASAAVENVWHVANSNSVIVDSNTVRLTGGSTSVEATDLGMTLTEETSAGFEWEATESPAECIGGAPRVFLVVNGSNVNSWDQNIGDGVSAACAGTFTVPAGVVTAAGVVWDNGQTGTVTVSNLTIGDTKVDFKATRGEPDPVVVTPQKPAYDKPTCTTEGKVTLRTTEGVKYTRTDADGKATVKAEAEEGYVLAEGKTKVWVFDIAKLTGEACEEDPGTDPGTDPDPEPTVIDVAKAAPTVTVECDGSAHANLPQTDRVEYTFVEWDGEYAVYNGKAKDGYVFPGDKETHQWRVKYQVATGCEQTGGDDPNPDGGAPATGGGDSYTNGGLAQTGAKTLMTAGIGGLLIAGGGIILVLLRRRRSSGGGAHRDDGDTQVMPAV